MCPTLTEEILLRFEGHWGVFYLIQPVADAILARTGELLSKHPLRAYDALQLAGCLALRDADPGYAHFACSNARLIAAARAEGMDAINPEESQTGGRV